MTAVPADYETVLQLVTRLSVRERFALVHDVLKTLEPMSTRKQPTLSRALGLLASTEDAPSDEVIEQWLDEHRMEKYGFCIDLQ